MKKIIKAIVLASVLFAGVAMATGFRGSEVTVISGTSEFSSAVGGYTYTQNVGLATGSAVLGNHSGFAVADYSTQHLGSATGLEVSSTYGSGAGGLNIQIRPNSLSANAVSGQQQVSQGGGGWYYYGGNTQALGSGTAAVFGVKGGADFTAASVDSQSALSNGWWNNIAAINGNTTSGGAINYTVPYGHH